MQSSKRTYATIVISRGITAPNLHVNGLRDQHSFMHQKGNANYQIDTEHADIREISLGNGSGQLVLKDGRNMLFWSVNEDSFLIKGAISEQEIIKMAENLKKKK